MNEKRPAYLYYGKSYWTSHNIPCYIAIEKVY